MKMKKLTCKVQEIIIYLEIFMCCRFYGGWSERPSCHSRGKTRCQHAGQRLRKPYLQVLRREVGSNAGLQSSSRRVKRGRERLKRDPHGTITYFCCDAGNVLAHEFWLFILKISAFFLCWAPQNASFPASRVDVPKNSSRTNKVPKLGNNFISSLDVGQKEDPFYSRNRATNFYTCLLFKIYWRDL